MAAFYNDVIAVLDAGSSKVCCLIAERTRSEPFRIIGSGHQASRGIRNGMISDMQAAQDSISQALATAEQMADSRPRSVIATLPCAKPSSRRVNLEGVLGGGAITPESLDEIIIEDIPAEQVGGSRLVHALPVSYAIDGERGIRNPVGMTGDRLAVEVHLINSERAFAANLISCLAKSELDVEAMVFPSFAAGLAVLNEDEQDLGTAIVDIGASRTTYGIFYDGSLVHAGQLPVGGEHVTHDLARSLSISVETAEWVKILHATADRDCPASGEIRTAAIGAGEEDELLTIPKDKVNRIVSARVEEIVERVRDSIESSGFKQILYGTVVLTGGASQLQGLVEVASRILSQRVRIGRAGNIPGLADALQTPAFAVAVGLLTYGERRPREFLSRTAVARDSGFRGAFRWFRENF